MDSPQAQGLPNTWQTAHLAEEERARLSSLISSITKCGPTDNVSEDVHTGMFILIRSAQHELEWRYDAAAGDPLDEYIPGTALDAKQQEECRFFINHLLKEFKLNEYLINNAEFANTHHVCVQLSAYHHRGGDPRLHKDGSGNLLFLILAFDNTSAIPETTVFESKHDEQDLERTAWKQLPEKVKGQITDRSEKSRGVMYEGGLLDRGACLCIIDELTYHGSPFEGARKEWADLTETEKQVQELLEKHYKTEELDRAKEEWLVLKKQLLNPGNRLVGIKYNININDSEDISLRLRLEFRLDVWSLIDRHYPQLMITKNIITDADGAKPVNVVTYSNMMGDEVLSGLRARAVSLGSANTQKNKSEEKRRFIRIWVKLISKNRLLRPLPASETGVRHRSSSAPNAKVESKVQRRRNSGPSTIGGHDRNNL